MWLYRHILSNSPKMFWFFICLEKSNTKYVDLTTLQALVIHHLQAWITIMVKDLMNFIIGQFLHPCWVFNSQDLTNQELSSGNGLRHPPLDHKIRHTTKGQGAESCCCSCCHIIGVFWSLTKPGKLHSKTKKNDQWMRNLCLRDLLIHLLSVSHFPLQISCVEVTFI